MLKFCICKLYVCKDDNFWYDATRLKKMIGSNSIWESALYQSERVKINSVWSFFCVCHFFTICVLPNVVYASELFCMVYLANVPLRETQTCRLPMIEYLWKEALESCPIDTLVFLAWEKFTNVPSSVLEIENQSVSHSLLSTLVKVGWDVKQWFENRLSYNLRVSRPFPWTKSYIRCISASYSYV